MAWLPARCEAPNDLCNTCPSLPDGTGAIGSLNTISTALSPLLSAGVYSLSERVAHVWPPQEGDFHLASAAMWLTSACLLVPVLAWTLYLRYVRCTLHVTALGTCCRLCGRWMTHVDVRCGVCCRWAEATELQAKGSVDVDVEVPAVAATRSVPPSQVLPQAASGPGTSAGQQPHTTTHTGI